MNSSNTTEWLWQGSSAEVLSHLIFELRMPIITVRTALTLLKPSTMDTTTAHHLTLAVDSANQVYSQIDRFLPLRVLPRWNTRSLQDLVKDEYMFNVLESIIIDIQNAIVQMQEHLQALQAAFADATNVEAQQVMQIALNNGQASAQKATLLLQEGIMHHLCRRTSG